jgi:hypothetical protein
MLKSYEAIYDHGHITWLYDVPQTERSRVIITLVEQLQPTVPVRRTPSQRIAGRGKTLANLIEPIVPEADWECLA